MVIINICSDTCTVERNSDSSPKSTMKMVSLCTFLTLKPRWNLVKMTVREIEIKERFFSRNLSSLPIVAYVHLCSHYNIRLSGVVINQNNSI